MDETPAVDHFSKISEETVISIFCAVDNPQTFALLCKRFHSICQQPYVIARYLLSKHGRRQAIWKLLTLPLLASVDVFDCLRRMGASFTSYLSNSLLCQWRQRGWSIRESVAVP